MISVDPTKKLPIESDKAPDKAVAGRGIRIFKVNTLPALLELQPDSVYYIKTSETTFATVVTDRLGKPMTQGGAPVPSSGTGHAFVMMMNG